MKRVHTTNVLLGVIAAEVILLTLNALAERRDELAASGHAHQPEGRNRQDQSSSGGLVQRLLRGLGRMFFGFTDDGKDEGRSRRDYLRQAEEAGMVGKEDRTEEEHDRPVPEGKFKDPAWAGLLAANNGNIALTQAERAVPMPKSAQYLGRLDKNPHVGKGMRDHSRDRV